MCEREIRELKNQQATVRLIAVFPLFVGYGNKNDFLSLSLSLPLPLMSMKEIERVSE
jgi:hypothetical protein